MSGHGIMQDDLFRNEAFSREQLLLFMDQWEQQVCSINKLLDNIMEWDTGLLNNKTFVKQPVDVHTLINEQVDLLSAKSRLKGNRIVNHIKPGPRVPGDKHMLGFVFRNLLDNANKFTSDGMIEITAGDEEGMLHLIFKDTGKGLLPRRRNACCIPGSGSIKTGRMMKKDMV